MKTLHFSRSVKLILVICAGGLFLAACQPHQGRHSGMMFDLVAYKLDLSEVQEEKLFAIKDEMKRLSREAMQEKQNHKQTLVDMINSDTLDQQQVLDMFQQHQEKIMAAAPSVIEKVAEFHASLTPDQKAKIVKKIESHESKHHGMKWLKEEGE